MKQNRKQKKTFLKTFISLAVSFVFLLGTALPVFAAGGMTISADSTQVQAGDAVTVTVTLTGKEIWAYRIELSSNQIFSGGETFVEDYDGSGSVEVSAVFYAMAPGAGEIYAEGSYSDGNRMKAVDDAVLQIEVEGSHAEEGRKEGTGGQAGPGQEINGETAPQEPETNEPAEIEKKETESETESKTQVTEPESTKTEKDQKTEQTTKSPLLWIILAALAVLVIIAVILAVKFTGKRKQNKKRKHRND